MVQFTDYLSTVDVAALDEVTTKMTWRRLFEDEQTSTVADCSVTAML